jgi:hypothetical protein
VFSGGLAFGVVGKVENLAVLRDRRTLYVCDSRPPVPHQLAFALVITSPKKENWSTFTQSPSVAQVIIPMFSLEEILLLREVAFSGSTQCCSVSDVRERFDKWGGSPRNILTKATDVAYQARLGAAGAGLSLAALKYAISTSTALDGVASEVQCHRLVNLVPCGAQEGSVLLVSDPRYYLFHHAELVSPHVISEFAKHLLLNDADSLYGFLGAAASDPAIAGFRGKLYERVIALPRVKLGGPSLQSLQLRRLTLMRLPGSAALTGDTLDWSASLPLIHFRSMIELRVLLSQRTDDVLLVPVSKEFPVVDFVLRKSGCFLLANATVAESHDIATNNGKFTDLLDVLGLGDGSNLEISLLWVLPTEAFERFVTAGTLKGASGKDLVPAPETRHPVGARIVQYAVCLPVPLTIAAAAAARTAVVAAALTAPLSFQRPLPPQHGRGSSADAVTASRGRVSSTFASRSVTLQQRRERSSRAASRAVLADAAARRPGVGMSVTSVATSPFKGFGGSSQLHRAPSGTSELSPQAAASAGRQSARAFPQQRPPNGPLRVHLTPSHAPRGATTADSIKRMPGLETAVALLMQDQSEAGLHWHRDHPSSAARRSSTRSGSHSAAAVAPPSLSRRAPVEAVEPLDSNATWSGGDLPVRHW